MTNDFNLYDYLYEKTNPEDIPNLDALYRSAWFEQLDYCDSPIEQILYVFLLIDKPADMGVCLQKELVIKNTIRRVDFLVALLDPIRPMFVVECDGKEHHSKLKDIEADKRRDREMLLTWGLPTIRYTGREIMSNPETCRREVQSLFQRGKTI